MFGGAAEIACTLGEARREGRNWRCRCPVHGGRSLVVRDGAQGRVLVTCWGGCDRRDVLAELRRLGFLGGRAADDRQLVRTSSRRDDDLRRIACARRIWESAGPATATPVEAYLASRGLNLPPPATLRWAPRCWHGGTRTYLPAMVALVEHVERGLVGVHRTYVTPDHHRRDRASLGPIRGGAVRLGAVRAGEWLAIAEGIETALSVTIACGIPSWAALSASGIGTLVLPVEATMVSICADNDANGVGQRAAQDAAQRFLAEGRRVRIAMPPQPGTDFNDVLLGREPKGLEKEAYDDVA